LVFVGTYTTRIRFGTGEVLEGKGEGIHAFAFDADSGILRATHVTRGVANPSYLALHPSGRFLYAVNELKTCDGVASGAVSAFAVTPGTGALTFLNRGLTYGTDPCHLTVDAAGRHVFVANFMSGSVCVLPIGKDGRLEAASDFIQHLGAGIDLHRQQGPHAHSVVLDATGRFACVPDLGLDRVLVYRIDAERGMLEPHTPPWIKMRPGAGPRQLVFHPGGRFAFLVNELDSSVAALAFDPSAGRFHYLHSLPTLPAGFTGASTGADIQISPSGRHVYVSNRGDDSIAIYAFDTDTARLTPLGHAATLGRTPRSFGIDPSGKFLLVANQDSDGVTVFRIDPERGFLQPTGAVAAVPTPVCVKFA
jgi:6-phosphogluconolactonase